MKTILHSGVSTRFARRISVLSIVVFIIILVVIWCIISLLNSFHKPVLTFTINTTRYKVPNRVSNNPQAIGNKDEKIVNQRLPLIHQPSSQSSVLRALLLFFPNDQALTFDPEFRWFYRSWTEMMASESASWRTDIIVYASEYTSFFKKLGCIYDQIRTNSEEKPQCRVFPYVRIKNRESNHEPSSKYQIINTQRSQTIYHHLRTYGYIDSINTVFEYNNSFSMYDFILRTDIDCFLTHNFALYVPYNNSILVGHGGYSTEFNNKRLKRISHDMNWKYADMNSLGSTWYGSPTMAHHMADYTIQAMTHLINNEFTTPEREQKLGVLLWPEWHFGVLLLYGGHLAINHLIATEKLDILRADKLLDQGVTSKDKTDISRNFRLHLHCWHGSEPFSKFAFKTAKYNHIDPSTLVSDTSASGYAMRMALESHFMTLEQLKQTLLDIKK